MYDDVDKAAEGPEPPCPEGHEYLGNGRCRDEYGEYNIDGGNREPKEGRCNALLKFYMDRYGEKRYCGCYPRKFYKENGHMEVKDADRFCKHHAQRHGLHMRAKELLQHGAYTKTREHMYDKLGPWDQVLCHGLHESLMADSVFEFAPEYESREFDFSEEENVPEFADEQGIVEVEIPHATEKIDRAQALWLAAVDTLKAIKVNADIAEKGMEVSTTSHADLVFDDQGNASYKTIEEKVEHHLNLSYSRIIRDKPELLSYGGVQTGTEADMEDNSKVIEEFTTISADPEGIQQGSGMVEIEPDTDIEEAEQ